MPAATIDVRVEGSGRPALLFVHGFGCDLTDWATQIENLSRDYCCIAMDLPGHGLSASPTRATIEALAEAVNGEKTRAPAAVVLVGHSMGCRVVAEAVNRAPERVIGVVLIDGSLTAAGGTATPTARTEAYLEKLFADICSSANSIELRTKLRARLARINRQFALELSLNAARWAAANGATALTQIKVPIQIIQATTVDAARTRVPLAPGKAAAWAASVSTLLPQAELRVISTASHFVMIEAAEDTTLMIREFVGRLTLGS